MVTTFTITSVDMPEDRTYALTSRVIESQASAFEHLREMADIHGDVEPYRVTTSASVRWTWEGLTLAGTRWSDTVRVAL